jgi:flagellar biosynthesis/type III secretory pathway M-ring protein FliF/YscJ
MEADPMQALNKGMQTISEQMQRLTPMSRLLIGSFMAILVLSLVIVTMVTSQSTMAPLGISPEANAQAITYLQGQNIRYEERNGQLFVPVDKTNIVRANLVDNNLIGPEQFDFESLISNDNPFTDSRSKARNYLIAKMNVLGMTISEMRGVKRARVVIDQPERGMGIGVARIKPTASVYLTTMGADLDQERVDAIAALLAGSHAGLDMENIQVVADGRLFQPRDQRNRAQARYYERKLEAENHTRKTLEDALAYIPGVRIAVNAQIDNRQVMEHRTQVEEPKVGPLVSRSETSENVNQSSPGESGVRPNTGTSIVGSGDRTSRSSQEKSEDQTLPVFPSSQQDIINHTGYALKINATIGIPRSYIVGLYRDSTAWRRMPRSTQTAVDALLTQELDKIRQAAEPLVDTGAIDGAIAGTVTVHAFSNFALASLTENGFGTGATGTGGGGGGLVGAMDGSSLVRNVGLGGLALVSLAMMFMIVRKAGVKPELPTAEEIVGVPPALAEAESDLVGEAGEADTVLEGVEIDDDAIRRQKILEQINDMAKQEPAEMASILRRWMKHGE